MAIFAFESIVRNAKVVVPENVVLPESAKFFFVIPEEQELANPSSAIPEFEITESEK